MNIIFILIGCSLMIALFFLGAFVWAMRSGQYEDKYTPAMRMLFDSSAPAPGSEKPDGKS